MVADVQAIVDRDKYDAILAVASALCDEARRIEPVLGALDVGTSMDPDHNWERLSQRPGLFGIYSCLGDRHIEQQAVLGLDL